MWHFGAQNGAFVMNEIFLVQTIIITFIYLLVLFIVQNLKKNSSSGSRVMRMRNFFGPKWPISPNENFFSENLLIGLVSFIHAYLHAKNQSQILVK